MYCYLCQIIKKKLITKYFKNFEAFFEKCLRKYKIQNIRNLNKLKLKFDINVLGIKYIVCKERPTKPDKDCTSLKFHCDSLLSLYLVRNSVSWSTTAPTRGEFLER